MGALEWGISEELRRWIVAGPVGAGVYRLRGDVCVYSCAQMCADVL